tara:strand:+ start:16 stop:531 length:516 start_codon:yes stop_codon:yes gene_type:complete
MAIDKNKLIYFAWGFIIVGMFSTTTIAIIAYKYIFSFSERVTSDVSRKNKLPPSNFSSDKTHKAMCGLNIKSCQILFKSGNLIVNEDLVIDRRQFRGVTKSLECRQRLILMPMFVSCFKSQYDKDYTISFSDENGLINSIQVSFRPGYIPNQKRWKDFQEDLKLWIENKVD